VLALQRAVTPLTTSCRKGFAAQGPSIPRKLGKLSPYPAERRWAAQRRCHRLGLPALPISTRLLRHDLDLVCGLPSLKSLTDRRFAFRPLADSSQPVPRAGEGRRADPMERLVVGHGGIGVDAHQVDSSGSGKASWRSAGYAFPAAPSGTTRCVYARAAHQDRRPDRAPRPLRGFPAGRGRGAAAAVRRDPVPDRSVATTAAAASGMSTEENGPRQPDGRGASMTERELIKCAQRDGRKPQHAVVGRPAGWSGPSAACLMQR
jgi:hypothetical protein